MKEDPKCPRCGTGLKVEVVRVPIQVPTSHTFHAGPPRVQGEGPVCMVTRYEERVELSDCPRCTGSY